MEVVTEKEKMVVVIKVDEGEVEAGVLLVEILVVVVDAVVKAMEERWAKVGGQMAVKVTKEDSESQFHKKQILSYSM